MDDTGKTTISVAIITRNEEDNLERCLRSVDWVDEIIIVDSGSIDKTKEIAEKYKGQFFTSEWLGFGKAKQSAIDRTKSDWVLSLDADEEITIDLKMEIIDNINSGSDIVGYKIPRLTYFLSEQIKHSGWYPDYVLRLFKNGEAQFTDNLVHEELICDGSTGKLENHMFHYPYPTLEKYHAKQNRYAQLAAQELYENGKSAGLLGLYIKPIITFLKHYIYRGGILGGKTGLQIASLSAQGKYKRYKKLAELIKEGANKC